MKLSGMVFYPVICAGLIYSPLYSWFDKTHIMIARSAGYEHWFNAAAPDIAKLKFTEERYNHFYNNFTGSPVTPGLVLSQSEKYNQNGIMELEGHLYGAIVAAVKEYKKDHAAGKYAEYHLAYMIHYIGDLSQPLHNVPYDSFNRSRHAANDGIIDKVVMDHPEKISKHMYEIKLSPARFETDLAVEIARIANLSRKLAMRMKQENRNMTASEAFIQTGHSASLIRAVLKYLGK